MASAPDKHAWSSHRRNALGAVSALVQTHPVYQSLGASGLVRQAVYREWVMNAIDPHETEVMRLHLQWQHALGSDRFGEIIGKHLNRRAGSGKSGRPRKIGAAESAI